MGGTHFQRNGVTTLPLGQGWCVLDARKSV